MACVLCHQPPPLALPGVVTGAILAFAKAIGEFGATITFVNIPVRLAHYRLLCIRSCKYPAVRNQHIGLSF